MANDSMHPSSVITVTSGYEFDATISRLTEALHSRGITIFADIDQAAAAENAGLSMRRTRLILFGNPKAGTPIMQANPYAALELPLRLAIWQDESGAVEVSYDDPADTLQVQYGFDAKAVEPFRQVGALLQGTLTRA